ncbi:MAG: hypothetical protein ACK493_08775 [Planctomycetota bacterium]
MLPRHGEVAGFWPSRKVLATPQGSAERDVSSLLDESLLDESLLDESLLDERLHDESLLGQALCAIVDAGLAWLH